MITSLFDVIQEMLLRLQPAFQTRGFTLDAHKNWFRRERGEVVHIYQLVFLDYLPIVEISPELAVRHELVEAIFHKTSGFAPAYRRDTPTVGGALAEISGDASYRLSVQTQGDISFAASKLLSTLDLAEAYFTRFSSLEAIDRELNDQPGRETPNRPMPWYRCSTGLIVARLVQRANYGELLKIYEEQMKAFSGGFYWSRFESLAQYLRTHSLDDLLHTK